MACIARTAPWVVLLTVLASVAGLYYTVQHLGINTSTADMLSPELPFRRIYADYKQAFPQNVDNLLVVIDGQTPEQAHHAAKNLASQLATQEQFKTIYQPFAGPFFETHGLLYRDLEDLEDLADNLAKVQPFLAQLWADQSLRGLLSMLDSALQALQEGESIDLEPMLQQVNQVLEASLQGQDYQLSWQELMSGNVSDQEARRRFIVLQPRLDYAALLAAEPAMQAVRQAARDLNIDAEHGLRLRITGGAALAYEELQSVSQGAGIAGLTALLMVLMLLSVGLRSLRLVLIILFTLLVGLIFTTTFATVAIGHLNLISVAFAVLYIGLGVDFAIHYCLRYRDAARTHSDVLAALRITAQDVGPALVLCAGTTTIGFYAFIPTAFAGVSELGLIAGTGMIISLLLSLTLLPALLRLWPLPLTLAPPYRFLPVALAEFPLQHAKTVGYSALALALIGLVLLPQAYFDHNPLHLQDQSTESVATFKDLLAHSETPPWSLGLLAEDAQTAQAIITSVEKLDSVGKVISLPSFVPEQQQDKLDVIQDMSFILGPELRSTHRQSAPKLEQQKQAIAVLLQRLSAHPEEANPWPQLISVYASSCKRCHKS